jgi:hypothetical protein
VAMSLSLSSELTKIWVNAVAINGVHWGSRVVLTATLLYFPELEAEL